MSDDTAPLTATLKGGEGYDAPWLTVRADEPQQLATRLDGVVAAGVGTKVAQAAVELQANWNAAKDLGATPVQDWQAVTSNPPTSAPQPPTGQVVQFPTAPQQAPQQTGVAVETDKFGNRYTRNVPGAPTCPHSVSHGPRILKEGLRKDGSPYKSYICPVVDKYFRVQTDCSPIYQ